MNKKLPHLSQSGYFVTLIRLRRSFH